MSDQINVLLIGGGGREHALAWKLAQSPRLGDLWITHPTNPGLAAIAGPDRTLPVPIDLRERRRLVHFCEKKNIALVVIGPEDPLAAGFADALAAPGRVVFGPGADGARLEADKAWAKHLMRTASIPTAEARTFTDPDAARAYIESREVSHVIKASGLARGKGVIVPDSIDEALDAIDRIMVERVFGPAGDTVIIEERLDGPEVSVFALTDGRAITILETCQDHKRLGQGDTGPNTGGMGAFCPSPLVDAQLMQTIEREILVPTVDALRRDGIDYRGVLYLGLMLTHAGPKVLEYNVRFGDPECQALMPRLDADLLEIMHATAHRRLADIDIAWKPGATCCVVLAAEGYPGAPRKGDPIEGIDTAEAMENVHIFHAGTIRDNTGRIVTNGGRVLSVVACGKDLAEARESAYRAADAIRFEGKVVRRDIASAAVAAAT
ncbi:MAG: phosphoribosylamine--glycine ligase [Planctomycetes bacterium]|nr:phosphoribosylamine--glycine ligase [Planctomycetota bacterium]